MTTDNKIKTGETSELQSKVVKVKRVSKVVKGGRRFSFAAIVVVGDGKGTVGHGLGKANEVTEAISKGEADAKKNLVKIPMLKNTIPHNIFTAFGGATVLLRPAAPGTGVLAGGAMRAVLESAGIKDVIGKRLGSSNPHNLVKATIKALTLMRDPRMVAKQRGVDLNKVFNA